MIVIYHSKMKIVYKEKKSLNPKQLLDLYESVKWASKKDKKSKGKTISIIYKNSQIVISAWKERELIGVIRALTDKIYNGVLFGLAVKSKYKGKSIGTELLKKCIEKYPKIRWYLSAENKKLKKFYEKAGFKVDKNIWFKK